MATVTMTLVLDEDDHRAILEELAYRKHEGRELPEGQSNFEGGTLAECIRDLDDYRAMYDKDHPRKGVS